MKQLRHQTTATRETQITRHHACTWLASSLKNKPQYSTKTPHQPGKTVSVTMRMLELMPAAQQCTGSNEREQRNDQGQINVCNLKPAGPTLDKSTRFHLRQNTLTACITCCVNWPSNDFDPSRSRKFSPYRRSRHLTASVARTSKPSIPLRRTPYSSPPQGKSHAAKTLPYAVRVYMATRVHNSPR